MEGKFLLKIKSSTELWRTKLTPHARTLRDNISSQSNEGDEEDDGGKSLKSHSISRNKNKQIIHVS